MRYPVKYPFRDRDGTNRERGDIMEIEDAARAASLRRRGLIGGALREPEAAAEPLAQELTESAAPEPTKYPIPLTGGYYQLPDGSKVRGKKAAEEAMRGDPNGAT